MCLSLSFVISPPTWARARLMARGERDVAARGQGAINAAASAGAVEIIADPPAADDGEGAARRARRGRRVIVDGVASAFVTSLQLNADSFED